MADNGGLFYSSGGGTISAYASFASDAAFVTANGTATNGQTYYNTTLNAPRVYEGGAWRTIYGVKQLSSQTTTYPITLNDDILLFNATGSAFTATLPTAVGNTGKSFLLKKTDVGFNAVTIATASSQTIDGITSTTLNTQYEALTLVSDGANWQVSQRLIPSVPSSYSATPSAGFGTTSAGSFIWRRIAGLIQIDASFTCGTVAASIASVPLPSGLTLNTPALTNNTRNIRGICTGTFTSAYTANPGVEFVVVDPSTSTTNIYFSNAASATNPTLSNGSAVASTNGAFMFTCTIPISGWNG